MVEGYAAKPSGRAGAVQSPAAPAKYSMIVDVNMKKADKELVNALRKYAKCWSGDNNTKTAMADAADAIVKLAKEAEEAKTKALNFNRAADAVLIAREYSTNWECLAKACQVDIQLALRTSGCTVCKYFKESASEVWCKNRNADRGDVSKCWEWRGLCAENIELAANKTGELAKQLGIK